jgi:hypothetical protein
VVVRVGLSRVSGERAVVDVSADAVVITVIGGVQGATVNVITYAIEVGIRARATSESLGYESSDRRLDHVRGGKRDRVQGQREAARERLVMNHRT